MSDTTKFAKYAEIMKKCRKVYNIVPIVYIVFGVFCFLVSFMFLIVNNLGAYFVFIDSLIFCRLYVISDSGEHIAAMIWLPWLYQ